MAKKSKQITLTQEEINSIVELQNAYVGVRDNFGSLEIARFKGEQELENISNQKLRLENEYSKLNLTEKELVDSLTKKYGAGNLDLSTGIFTPTK
jgi:wobble nucleotide-excising tRNase|tara:strand:+ start:166 stop:450 length:285 start_codon:yes stop_codon:yes gene_type:complete